MIRKNLFVSILVSSLMVGANLSGVSAEVPANSENSSKTALKTVCVGFGTYGILSGTVSFLKHFDILKGVKSQQNIVTTFVKKYDDVLDDDKFGKYIGEPKNAEDLAFWFPAVTKTVAGIGGLVVSVFG